MRNPRIIVVLAIGLCVLFAACSQPAAPTPAPTPTAATSSATPVAPTAQPTATSAPPTAAPTETQAPPAPTAEPTTPPEPDPRQVLLEERCALCHSLDRVYSQEKDEAGWRDTVERMIARGAQLDEEEKEQLINYLAAEY